MSCLEVKTYTNRLDCLSSYLRFAVFKASQEFKDIVIAQTYRNPIYQAYLYWSSRDEEMHKHYAQMLGLEPKFAKGKHKTYTLRSLHSIFSAVDIYFVAPDGSIINEPSKYKELYSFMAKYAPITWGGFFKNRDYGHYELALSEDTKEKLFSGSYTTPAGVDAVIRESLKKKKFIYGGK